jgi:hypothetical protein
MPEKKTRKKRRVKPVIDLLPELPVNQDTMKMMREIISGCQKISGIFAGVDDHKGLFL